jgi:hypothetical protein
MFETPSTSTIEVKIGRHTRYPAFITTAPAILDAPSTLTLYSGPLKDIASLAVDDLPSDVATTDTPSRLVLIDTLDVASQHGRCRGQGHRLTQADSVVVGATLRLWLSQRALRPDRHDRGRRAERGDEQHSDHHDGRTRVVSDGGRDRAARHRQSARGAETRRIRGFSPSRRLRTARRFHRTAGHRSQRLDAIRGVR